MFALFGPSKMDCMDKRLMTVSGVSEAASAFVRYARIDLYKPAEACRVETCDPDQSIKHL